MPDAIIQTTEAGWPYLDEGNYWTTVPDYTAQLARKLESGQADLPAAMNAAQVALGAAAALGYISKATVAGQNINDLTAARNWLYDDPQLAANLANTPRPSSTIPFKLEVRGGVECVSQDIHYADGARYSRLRVGKAAWSPWKLLTSLTLPPPFQAQGQIAILSQRAAQTATGIRAEIVIKNGQASNFSGPALSLAAAIPRPVDPFECPATWKVRGGPGSGPATLAGDTVWIDGGIPAAATVSIGFLWMVG